MRRESDPSLIRAIYEKKQLEVKDESLGIYKFSDWLPIHKTLEGSSAPATYKSEGLAKYLGLNNLYITFSGYWPEKGANFRTCSFKETEAYAVSGRLNSTDQVLVVASAGIRPEHLHVFVPIIIYHCFFRFLKIIYRPFGSMSR